LKNLETSFEGLGDRDGFWETGDGSVSEPPPSPVSVFIGKERLEFFTERSYNKKGYRTSCTGRVFTSGSFLKM
jgi:hypothetical protein